MRVNYKNKYGIAVHVNQLVTLFIRIIISTSKVNVCNHYFWFCPISFGAKETGRKENMCDEIFLNLLSQSLDRIFILLEKASVTRGINPTQTDTCNLKTVRSWSKFKKFHMHGFKYTLIFKLFS